MTAPEKMCSLILDKMSIKSRVEFDRSNGRFCGNVSLPSHTGIATHALVFMLGGVTTRWKQTVAYYFTGNSTNGRVIKEIITEIIQCASNIGLNIIYVTCDMGSSNRALWKDFEIGCSRNSVKKNFIQHPYYAEKRIYFLDDIPYVVKNIRNHLANGQSIIIPQNLVVKYGLPSDTINIEPIRKLAVFQQDLDLKPAPNLISKLLEPSHFDKMKVSMALHVFSHSVNSALRLMVEVEKWNNETLTTAWFVELMDK